MGYLIDTCIWIDVERGRLHPDRLVELLGGEPVFLSPVTIAEMQYGAERASTADLRQQRLAGLVKLKSKPVLTIDAGTGEMFGNLAAQLGRAGRGHLFRIQDLWLASQAIQHHLTLVTRNAKDFAYIPGLRLQLI